MKDFIALLRKDMRLELRGGESLVLLVVLALLLSVIISFGVTAAFIDTGSVRKLFPALVWIVFVFSATVSIGKSFDFELEHMGLEGLLLTGVSPVVIYLAKVLSSSLLVLIGHGVTLAVLALLLNVDIISILPELLLLSVGVAIAYCALATLFSTMTGTSRLRQMLLPLVMLPLLFPLFFAGVELTAMLLTEGGIDIGSPWLSLLVGLNVVYLALGINLYEVVVRD